jgi:hypothetical protein
LGPEYELIRHVASTRDARGHFASEIESLLERSDPLVVGRLLSGQRMVQLLGARIRELSPGFGGETFAAQVERATADARRRAMAIETLASHLREQLDARGIAVLPVKGPFLARRLYCDPALRSTNDLDLLVDASRLDEAIEAIAGLGFEVDERPRDEIHRALRHPQGMLPRIEVHWRLHWYENCFSSAMLTRAARSGEWLMARADDELAALLLFYARDGFYGLRTAADIGAWWDRYGDTSGGAPVLAEHIRHFPQLRKALVTASRVAEDVVGVPSAAVVPAGRPTVLGRLAARLANPMQIGETDQLRANVALVDGLLGVPTDSRAFVRRRLWIPRAEVATIYGLDDPDGLRARIWQVAHGPKLCTRFLLGIAGFRGSSPQHVDTPGPV